MTSLIKSIKHNKGDLTINFTESALPGKSNLKFSIYSLADDSLVETIDIHTNTPDNLVSFETRIEDYSHNTIALLLNDFTEKLASQYGEKANSKTGDYWASKLRDDWLLIIDDQSYEAKSKSDWPTDDDWSFHELTPEYTPGEDLSGTKNILLSPKKGIEKLVIKPNTSLSSDTDYYLQLKQGDLKLQNSGEVISEQKLTFSGTSAESNLKPEEEPKQEPENENATISGQTASHYSLKAEYDYVKEGGFATFIITRTGDTNVASSVNFSTFDGTAKAETGDYEAVAEELIFGAGIKKKTVMVDVAEDKETEENEFFTAQLNSIHENDTVSEDVKQIVTDWLPSSAYQIKQVGASSTKEGNKAKFHITRTGNTAFPGSVKVYTQNGSALAGHDYYGISKIINFNFGEKSKSVIVKTKKDRLGESDEYFTIRLTKVSGIDSVQYKSLRQAISNGDKPKNNGDDTLYGTPGDEEIDGGPGNDTAVFSDKNNSIYLSGTSWHNTGEGKDRLISIENVDAGAGNDLLEGNKSANILKGQSGNDTILGGHGNDIIDGGEGIDTARFLGHDNRIDLGTTGWQNTGEGKDRLISIENVFADSGNDYIIGNDAANMLRGMNGNDTFYGGMGNDIIDGGKGSKDTALFSNLNNIIDLNVTGSQNTRDGKDVLISIENVKAGAGDDVVFGSSARNILMGQDGNDRLYGNGGDDLLIGGGGKDKVWGGGGRDDFRIQSGKGYTIIQDFTDNQDTILLLPVRARDVAIIEKNGNAFLYYGSNPLAKPDLLAKVIGAAGKLQPSGDTFI